MANVSSFVFYKEYKHNCITVKWYVTLTYEFSMWVSYMILILYMVLLGVHEKKDRGEERESPKH